MERKLGGDVVSDGRAAGKWRNMVLVVKNKLPYMQLWLKVDLAPMIHVRGCD